ncbi:MULTISPECIES: TetR/AcrR family transcriptional regulator [Subtercola]|uniref:TetR/AcrR family transcriptional regulator n=1 Tax=Subtercola vilae TaxID=2056433 RepID=A0A4V4RG66_9MICO|nr:MULTISPECIES: TetR/AcrR family transcriptional regulator [Subtercola]MEA9983825.1 TetR/AcrR family transcriptional regulator [Subtercola sp. RTI3]TIH40634.1 TetR/AcrR family transcriptional regulator [Subtercola vilae]
MAVSNLEYPAVRTFTAKGLATRERIVVAASSLMLEHGVDAAKLEDIQAEARVSASQLYHYFEDKSALILAVIDHQTDAVLGMHRQILVRLDSFTALQEWRDLIVASIESNQCVGGCPLGSLASGLAESDPLARAALAKSFAEWQRMLRVGLETMRDHGELRADIDAESLSLSILASVQGGLLLSQTRRDSDAVRASVDMAIAYLKTLR